MTMCSICCVCRLPIFSMEWCETLIIEGVTKLPAYELEIHHLWTIYYTIAKTSHIQQRIIGKKWKALAKVLSIHPPPASQHNTPCICWGMLWPWPRLCFNIIPTFVCTVQHERQIYADWNDVSWSTFFNDTTLTTSQEIYHYHKRY
jgi:hypothetical protein